jgi:hypothetical protein
MEKLTVSEKAILKVVLEAVIDNLQYDDEENIYRETYEDWMLSLDKNSYQMLKSASEKI